MVRGTTPDYVLTLEGIDLTGKTVLVTIKQQLRQMTLTGDRLSISTEAEGSAVAFRLTQEETLRLSEGTAEVQVRYIGSDNLAWATEIGKIDVKRVLLNEVIHDADNPA